MCLAVHCRLINFFHFYTICSFSITENTTKVKLASKLAIIQTNKSMEPKGRTVCCCRDTYGAHCIIMSISLLLEFHLESKIRKNGYIKVVITVRTDVEVSSNLLCVVYSHVCSCNLRHKNCSHPQRAVPQCFIAAVHYKVRAKDVHSSSYFVELWESVMSRNSCDCFKVSFLIITWQF